MENLSGNDFIEKMTDDGVGMLFVKERYFLDQVASSILLRIKNKGFKLVYITASLPSKSIEEKLNEVKFNDYYVIDCVTTDEFEDNINPDKCVFMKSPGDLTNVSITLENFLSNNNNVFIIIDSITSLLIYNSENEILRFVHFTSSTARSRKSKLVFVVLENKGISEEFLDKMRSFIDEEAVLG